MRMQPHERAAILFLLKHLVSGIAGALTLGTGLLVLDVAKLGTLIANSPHAIEALVLLFLGLSVTFGSVAMGIGVMGLGAGEAQKTGPEDDGEGARTRPRRTQ